MLKKWAVGLIRVYQRTISPDHGWFKGAIPTCRFTPTCSEYMSEAITDHGIIAGVTLGARRIARCHPWHPGGYDPVPKRK